MRKWTVPALLTALFLAVALRLQPLFRFEIWGSDTGEYYTLIKGIVDRGYISTVYNGWGFGYPYFPGAEVLVGACNIAMGADLLVLLKLVLPVLGALTTVVAFLIGWTAFRDERAGLIAAGIVAVAMPHVFATSHPMPGSLGDLLLAICILLYLKLYENRTALVPLVIASLALVPTHHLSAFFVFVPLMFVSFMREILRSKEHPVMVPVEPFYLGFMLTANLVYWLGIAIPFRDQVMSEAFGVSPFIVAAGAMGMLLVAALIVHYRRSSIKFRYTPRLPTLNRLLLFIGVGFTVVLAFLAFTAFVQAPGTNVSIPPEQVLLLLPTTIIITLAIAGVAVGEFSRRGLTVWLWLAAVSIILLISIFTKNTVLISYRIFEYVTLPAALLTGWGITYMADLSLDPGPGKEKGPRIAVALGVSALLLVSAAVAYPPKGLLGGFEEGTTVNELEGVAWAGQEVPVRQTLIATDHRMSSMMFGFDGLNGTWDYAYHTFHDDLNGSRQELKWVRAPSGHGRINYVLIDDAIRSGVALKQWENARPMSKVALAKFNAPPFNKIYESNGSDMYFVGLTA
jgi:hypothetical protein